MCDLNLLDMNCSLNSSIQVYINNPSIAGMLVIAVIIAVNDFFDNCGSRSTSFQLKS